MLLGWKPQPTVLNAFIKGELKMEEQNAIIRGDELVFLTANGVISGFVEEVWDERFIKISDISINGSNPQIDPVPDVAFVSFSQIISFWRRYQ